MAVRGLCTCVRARHMQAELAMVAGGCSLRRALRHGVGVIGFRQVSGENNSTLVELMGSASIFVLSGDVREWGRKAGAVGSRSCG